jgi:alpha-beta hydrolase superfamily lysophospholipase
MMGRMSLRRRPIRILAPLLAAWSFLAGIAGAQGPLPDLTGAWRGALDPDGLALTVVLRFEAAPDGLRIELDVPPQGAFGLPVELIERGPGGGLALRAPTLPAAPTFDGTVDGERYEGTFTQGPAELPFVLERSAEASSDPDRPQVPVPPFPYATHEIVVDGPAGTLAGTIALPPGPGPHPLAVLINGSGAQDRDATVLGHPIMAVVADHLARNGIGSVRWDDRGVGGSAGDLASAGAEGLVADVEAIVAAVAARPDVDAGRIALVGHSEGGLVAPLVAVGDAPVAAVVLLAAPAVSGLEVLLEQNRRVLAQGGATAAQIEDQLAYLRELGAAFERDDLEAARALTRARVEEQLDALPAGQVPTGPERDAYVDAQAASTGSATFAAFVRADPEPVLRRLRVPTLALFFSLDVQVITEQNAEPMRAALAEAGVPAEVRVLEGLNHLMQPAETGGLEEYATISTTVDERALEAVSGWLVDQLGVGP